MADHRECVLRRILDDFEPLKTNKLNPINRSIKKTKQCNKRKPNKKVK